MPVFQQLARTTLPTQCVCVYCGRRNDAAHDLAVFVCSRSSPAPTRCWLMFSGSAVSPPYLCQAYDVMMRMMMGNPEWR